MIYHPDGKRVTVTTMDGEIAEGSVVGVYSSLEEWGRDILRHARLFHPELLDEPAAHPITLPYPRKPRLAHP